MSENTERTDLPEAPEKKPFLKRIPVMSLPAVIALVAMAVVFVLTFCTSMQKLNIRDGIWNGPNVGFKNYSNFINSGALGKALGDSLAVNGLRLLICGVLSAALCSLYRLFKKPGTVLTLACLWLIPVCLPTAFMAQETRSLLHFFGELKAHAVFLYAMGLQTIGMFCFTGGLFAYLNLRKNGQVGKAPYMGLLTTVLVFLLGNLTTRGLYYGFGTVLVRTFDEYISRAGLEDMNFFAGNAVSVLKIGFQILIGIIPAIFLYHTMPKEKALGEETPKSLFWLFPAALAGILLVLFCGCHDDKMYAYFGTVSVNSLMVSLAGGAFGGLIAWSFIHLLKRSSLLRFVIVALILSASVSCINLIYLLIRYSITRNDLLPQVLCSAFDWRVILLVIILAFIFRSHKEIRSGFLVLSLCLLIAAFAWGEISNQVLWFNMKTPTVPMFYFDLLKAQKVRPALLLQVNLLMVVPPLLIGLGSALLMRKAFQKAEPRGGSPVPLSEPEAHSEIQA